MHKELAFFIKAVVSIFIIVNPIGAVPIYLGMSEGQDLSKHYHTVRVASITCFCVLLVFTLLGNNILHFFGITLPSFRIAGGIILFIVSLHMLQAKSSRVKTTPEEHQEGSQKEDIAVVPLAVPLLSGPAAITTVLVLRANAKNLWEVSSILLAIGLTSWSAYIVLKESVYIQKILGQTGINIITRIMGLILAAISVQFIMGGVHDSMPYLLEKVIR